MTKPIASPPNTQRNILSVKENIGLQPVCTTLPTSQCTVVIIEDDPHFRKAFVDAVCSTTDFRLVGVADDVPEGLFLLEQVRPDILLVDIGLPSGSGLVIIRKASEMLPQCDIMVVTVFGDERHVIECIEAGATGYLLKGSQEFEILTQIRALRAGGSPISPVIARQLLARFQKIETQVPSIPVTDTPALSAQEQTVLELSAKGYRYEEIAKILELSSRTIETYVKRIYRKLQVHNKSEAIYEARKLGLLRD